MTEEELRGRIHDLDATLRVGKSGIESVAPELETQLDANDLVKVKFLRAARTNATEALAEELATAANAELLETRGHTATYR